MKRALIDMEASDCDNFRLKAECSNIIGYIGYKLDGHIESLLSHPLRPHIKFGEIWRPDGTDDEVASALGDVEGTTDEAPATASTPVTKQVMKKPAKAIKVMKAMKAK